MSEQQRYVRIDRCGAWAIMTFDQAIEEVTECFQEGAPGESLVWRVVEMTREEFDALPEFEGW